MISAKVICDSISPEHIRITTFELRYPKFIHGEFMTHRVFSRNASSSRAIPTAKLLEEVRSDDLRAGPVSWGKNMPGMQAGEELTGEELSYVKTRWKTAALYAAGQAEFMLKAGCHKQIVNRLLEPFSHINVVVTATEYMNFFGLRLDKNAQPEIQELAKQMWKAYQESEPELLQPGEWHLPYNDKETLIAAATYLFPDKIVDQEKLVGLLIKISVARCARVSYKSFETGKVSTIEEDLKLYDRLLGGDIIHASPAEHQATPDEMYAPAKGLYGQIHLHGNFTGWIQYRKTLEGENMAPLPEEYNRVGWVNVQPMTGPFGSLFVSKKND